MFIGIWPFDADAMRDKVVPSTSTLTTTASNVSAVPTNILQPNSSMSSMLSCSSASSSVTSVSKFVNTSNADPTDTALRTSTFNDIIPIQPTIVDDDIQLFNSSDMSTYTTLQSCPLDLTINHRPKNKRATSSPERSYKSRRNRINNGEYFFQHKNNIYAVVVTQMYLVHLLPRPWWQFVE